MHIFFLCVLCNSALRLNEPLKFDKLILARPLEHIYKFVEKIAGVQRTGGGFRMELYAHEGLFPMSNAFVGTVVGVEEPRLPTSRQGCLVDSKAVIL